VQNDTHTQAPTSRDLRILRRPEVKQRVGLSGEEIDKLEREGKFPGRVSPSPRTVGWIEHEIDLWIQQRIAERDDLARAEQLKFDRAPPAVRHRLRQAQQLQNRREEAEILAGLQRTELSERERAGDVWADIPT
jgi:prophage regulatory protein